MQNHRCVMVLAWDIYTSSSIFLTYSYRYNVIEYSSRDWEEFFVKETMAPYFDHIKGPFQICNGPFQISNGPQLWLVKLRASLCIDKYHFLDLYGLCKGFSDVGVSVPVDSLDCSTCVSDPVFVFPKFSLSTYFVVFLTKRRVCWPANCNLMFLCLAGISNFVVCKLNFN